ncbi:MAG TPA: DMT family transporter [Prolixibacteraceae bacterium]|nr:DMT family transporter [Prolixibacteraceae bacterium]
MTALKSDRFKGYLFAILATLSFSIGGYVFSKAAMNEISQVQLTGPVGQLVVFIFYWFLVAFVLNLAWSAFRGNLAQLMRLSRRQYGILILLGIMEVLTNTSFYLSLQIIPDPSVTSFLGNLYPVILTLMGVTLLKERFTWLESVGVFLALTGAFVISYTGETSLQKMFIPGTLVVLINAILASSTSVIGKINVRQLTPEIIVLNGTFWLLISASILMLTLDVPFHLPVAALSNIAAGAFLGPFLGVLMIYYSFKFIEASRSSIVQSTKGIVVMGGVWIYFGTLPLKHQIIGGLLTVAGVLIMTLAKAVQQKSA